MMNNYDRDLYEFLKPYVSENRLARIESIVAERTRYITIAVEDIYQPHNASAVMRSAECFGIQDIHVIENKNSYRPNQEIAKGSNKWMTFHHHNEGDNNTSSCIRTLKQNGYRIIATTPHERSHMISDVDVTKGKIALFFGTELEGISEEVKKEADEFVRIPMYGFTESFNISVSAAICLFELRKKLQETAIEWALTEEEKAELKLHWVKNSIQRVDVFEEEFRNRRKSL